MRIHGYNKEKNVGFADLYILAIFLGTVAAITLIALGFGVRFIAEMIKTYWAWVLGIGFGLVFLRHFLSRRKK